MPRARLLPCLAALLPLVACKPETGADPGAEPQAAPAEPAANEPAAKANPPQADPAERAPDEPSERPQVSGPSSGPSSGGAFAFEQVYRLERRELEGGSRWLFEREVGLSEQDERLLDDYDGVRESLDASHAHIYAPLSLGQKLLLVTPTGQREASISGFGLNRTLDADVLTVILGEAKPDDPSGGLVVGGAHMPVASAKLRASEGKPPTPSLLAVLQHDYELAKPKVLSDFEPLESDAERPRAEALSLRADCIRHHSELSMPDPFIGVISVECGGEQVYEARIHGLFLLDAAGTPQAISKYDRWEIGYGGSELDALVDLDGDGIDELLITDAGYEYYTQRQLAWSGEAYLPFPP